jgi:hypothetical protein
VDDDDTAKVTSVCGFDHVHQVFNKVRAMQHEFWRFDAFEMERGGEKKKVEVKIGEDVSAVFDRQRVGSTAWESCGSTWYWSADNSHVEPLARRRVFSLETR